MIETTTIEITPEILALVAEIEEFKGAWQAIGRISPERLSALRRVATIESAGSSTRIEGTTLDNREVERLLSNLDLRSFTSRDEQEVAGYAVVMETVFESAGAIALTEHHILQLHRDLLRFSDKDARHRGAYKTLPNHVEAVGPEGRKVRRGVRNGNVLRYAAPDARAGRLDSRPAPRRRSACAHRHRDLHRGVLEDPSFPGRKRPPVSHSDDAASAASRI